MYVSNFEIMPLEAQFSDYSVVRTTQNLLLIILHTLRFFAIFLKLMLWLPNLIPSYGENGQCTQKKYISLSPLLAQCRSEMLFFFFLPYTPSLRVCMERRRKKHSHSCTVPGVGRGKCIFSGRIVRFLHMGVFYWASRDKICHKSFFLLETPWNHPLTKF